MPDSPTARHIERRLQWAGLTPEDVKVEGCLVTLTLPLWELERLIGEAATSRSYRVDL
jgi:hypothetical protein